MLSERYMKKAWYVDSPQNLLKLDDCQPGIPYTLVPLEDDLAAIEQTFTISAFSNSPFALSEATPRFPYSTNLSGAWAKDTAGGNAHSPTYSRNPQYSVTVPQKTSISLLLEAASADVNVHIKLVHSKGQRMHGIRSRDIIFDSGDYRRGCCVAERSAIEAGQYTIICSTFEPQELSDFILLVESSLPTQTVLLPKEGAGRIRMELSTVAFQHGQNAVAAPLVPRRLVKFYAIARQLDALQTQERSDGHSGTRASHRSMIRLSVEIGRGPQRRVLISSGGGEFTDSAAGVRMEDIDISPDMLRFGDVWLVLDRVYASSESKEETFRIELFVDQPDAVACGVWRPWYE